MANQEIQSTAASLRRDAFNNFRNESNIDRALRHFSQHSEEFDLRVIELETAAGDLVSMLETQVFDSSIYRNVALLGEKTGRGGTVRTLVEAVGICRELERANDYSEDQMIREAFGTMRRKVAFEWEFTRTVEDPNKLASGMLVECYGVYVEKLNYATPDSGIARATVLAIEEILCMKYPSSALFRDALDWMKEEKGDFSPTIAMRLEAM